MEPASITLHIRKDTATALIAVAAGFLLVGTIFFTLLDEADHWIAVRWSVIAAGVVSSAVAAYFMRPPVSRRASASTIFGIVALSSLSVVLTHQIEQRAEWQRDHLRQIRSLVARNILLMESTGELRLFDVLRQYHDRGAGKRSIGEIFRSFHPNAAPGSDLHVARWPSDSLKLLLETVTDSSVTVIGIDPIARGRDARFVTAIGRAGAVQMRFTVTPRGVRHVEEN